MIFIFSVARIVTATLHFESSHRFKTLRLDEKAACRWRESQVVFAGGEAESFSLREMKLDNIS
jgi:hypothetical protein